VNTIVVASVWAGAGLAAGLAARLFRLRRLVVLAPAAGALAALLVPAGPGHSSVVLAQSGLTLDHAALGLIAAGGGSLVVALLLAPRLDGRESLTYGLVGATVTIALGTGSPVVWAVVLLAAVGLLSLRWISTAPSRATLAAARVPGAGTAALLAASPFLPLVGIINGPRPEIAAALLGVGVASLLALLPLGGWAAAALGSLRGTEVAPWALLLAPSVLLVAERIPASTPAAGDSFARILLAAGLVTALFNALQAIRPNPRERYSRLLLADLGLAAAAVGAAHPALALQGALLLILTHMALGPFYLSAGRGTAHPVLRQLAWLALSGLPPAPSFWARFLLLEALVQVGAVQAAAAIIAAGVVSVVCILAAFRGSAGAPTPEAQPRPFATAVAWLSVASAFAVGVAPAAATARVFGI
jgi:multicomponent Na+:H+ antiporter subunit D